jgi:putative membrane-bound dehydrogenase-like protein
MVVDPVAVAWDERGRMYVVEDRGYPTGPGKGNPPAGQVVLLEDTDGDGKYDKRAVFADGLTFPNGVMPWNGGVYVTCAPYLYYFKDTDGDGIADVKQTVFKGFQDLSTTQLRVSHPTLAIDNWVYLTSGLTAAKVVSPAHTNREPVFLNRVDGRFRPGTDEIEPTAGTAQFGQTFDAFGRRFICSNRNHIQHVVMQLRYLQRNPHLSFSQLVEDCPDHGPACKLYPLSANIVTAAYHGGFVTSACGVTIYNGTALPDEYRGNSFTCEPAGNLVHRDVLAPDGATFVAKRAYPTNEFLASPDNWFRPVNLAVGPDGALYVCDMYRKTIEHPEYLPEATRKVTDFESGRTMGRIYRIVKDDSGKKSGVRSQKSEASKRKFDLGKASVKELCAQLENPNAWWRMTAHRLLLEKYGKDVVPSLEKLAMQGKTAEARVHALHILDGRGAMLEDLVLRAMADKDPAVREHAIQLSESHLPSSQTLALARRVRNEQEGVFFRRYATSAMKLMTNLLALADDPNPRVRFQCALTLGDCDDDRIIPALAKIAGHDMDDKWARAAVLSSITKREEQFARAQLPRDAQVSSKSYLAMKSELCHILASALPQPRLIPMLRDLLSAEDRQDLAVEMAAVGGFGDGLRARGLGSKEHSALLSLVAEDSSNLYEQVNKLFTRSGELALDAKQPLSARLAAVSLLGQADEAIAGGTLEKLVEPQQPAELQTAAVRALGQFAAPDIGKALVTRERWNAYTPGVRDAVLSAAMANTNLLTALFNAIAAGDVPPTGVNEDRRNQLMRHKDEAIKARATALFKEIKPSDRMKVYDECKSSVLALKGDSKNGHAQFQKICITCHTFAAEGKLVGPDLTGIRNQPADVILLHIIVPEYEINPIYTCYNVETKGGEAYTGLLGAETPTTITLRMAQGIEQKIPRADIATMTTSRLSLMPQELEKTMTKQELADLLEFLKGQ